MSGLRFGSARPVLTTLGQRLITLSDRKLYALEPPIGGRDKATLLKGVLIQESVNSAWRAVERGQQVQVTDWSTDEAIGLDVIGEEDEVMDEAEEARWYDQLVQNLNEDEPSEEHEWTESEVGSAVDEDDFESYQEYEQYTLPSPPLQSPPQLPSSPTSPSAGLSTLDAPASPDSDIEVEHAPVDVAVHVAEVDDDRDVSISASPPWPDSIPLRPFFSAARSSSTASIPTISLIDCDLDSDLLALPLAVESSNQVVASVTIGPAYADARPATPLLSANCSPSLSPIPGFSPTGDELDCDDLVLPPALHRCSSTSSIPCDCEDVESDADCQTPPSSYDELDTSIASLLSLHLDDDCQQVVDHPSEAGDAGNAGSEKRSHEVEEGLGLWV
jgi:hypothetical protein